MMPARERCNFDMGAAGKEWANARGLTSERSQQWTLKMFHRIVMQFRCWLGNFRRLRKVEDLGTLVIERLNICIFKYPNTYS